MLNLTTRKINKTSLLLIILVSPLLIFQEVYANDLLWTPIVSGIDYREFYLSGPNHMYVARMDRSNPDVTLETSIGQGKISGELEAVSEMAARYDQAINYWGDEWGGRNQVVAAINGYFYDTETGIPWRGQVHSGWYAKRFDDLENGSGFAWKFDRSIFLGGCVVHHPKKQQVKNLQNGEIIYFENINTLPEDDEITLYTPQFAATTPNQTGIEILIQLNHPALVLGTPAFSEGKVVEVRDGLGPSWIPFDHIIISGFGQAASELRDKFNPGDAIAISQEIKDFESDCKSESENDWSRTYAAIGGSFVFLNNGVIQKFDDLGAILRNARTAIAYNNRYIFFIVAADRENFGNLGLSIVELANFTKNTLGASWGIALDGGGSSTMFANGEIKNKLHREDPEVNDNNIERAVANGVMMVYVQPKELSTRFSAGDRFLSEINTQLSVRLGPGTNYFTKGTVPPQSQGVVLDHPSGLNGVRAKDHYWWFVSIDELQGWVAEEFLVPVTNP